MTIIQKRNSTKVCSVFIEESSIKSALHDWLLHCNIPYTIISNSNSFEIQFVVLQNDLIENIEQMGYAIPNFYTTVNLLKLMLAQDQTMTKLLVFVATKKLADELYTQLETIYLETCGVIHSNKEQNHRFNTVKQFHEGTYRFIIATDIVARGIDISEVTHVINFDVPEVPENYIHRIGRTGRADKKGIAITFFTAKEKPLMDTIQALMKYEVPLLPLPENLEISEVLTEDEIPKVFMKTYLVKLPKKEEVGPAFHQKSAKNSKINVIVRKKDRMMKKYGKPKTRGQKPTRKK